MTPAGLNSQIRIWRMASDLADDVVGGAQITGSVVGVFPARIQAQPTEQVFLQQGLKTLRVFRAVVVPGTVVIYERDEVELTQPTDHEYFGNKFRIVGIQKADHNPRDPRNYTILHLTRSVRAHAEQ